MAIYCNRPKLNDSPILSVGHQSISLLELYLGLIVGREDFGPTFHRGVVILEILLDLFHRVRTAI